MALETNNFLPLSAMANSNAVRVWSYETDADNAAAVETANYFDDSFIAGVVEVGDVVLVKSTDATKFYNFITVDNTAGAPNVVISTGLAIP
jgi:hypothetical protein